MTRFHLAGVWRPIGALAACVILESAAQDLRFGSLTTNGEGGVDGITFVGDTAISPDGAHVYAVGRIDDAVAAFSRDGNTGELTFVEVERDGVSGVDGLDGAESVIVSGDGKHVYVAGSSDSSVVVFSRNSSTGALTFIERQQDGLGGVEGLLLVYGLALSPDGDHLYTAARGDSAVAVFERDANDGRLTFVEAELDTTSPDRGLLRCEGVTVSPDGMHVYVVSGRTNVVGESTDHAINLFSRDAATGALTFVQSLFDEVGGVDGLEECVCVAVSPDGKFVYSACHPDDDGTDWLGVFARDSADGTLTFVEALDTNALPSPSLLGTEGDSGLGFSPTGNVLYATNPWQSAAYALARDPATGRLTLLDMISDVGFDDLRLFGAEGLSVSPDGRHLYVAAKSLNAVSHLHSDPLLRIEDIVSLPNGGLRLVGRAEPGAPMELQHSTTLLGASWNTILTLNADGTGEAVFEVSSATIAAERAGFFRLLVP